MRVSNLGRFYTVIALAAVPAVLSDVAAAQLYALPPAPPPEAADTAYPGGPAGGRTTTPIHPVSLHAGPNGAAPVIGTLQAGAPVEVLAVASPGWLQVRFAGGEGWAWSSFFPGAARGLADSASPVAAGASPVAAGASPVAAPPRVYPGGAPRSGRQPPQEINSP
jgi:hypothetical protein